MLASEAGITAVHFSEIVLTGVLGCQDMYMHICRARCTLYIYFLYVYFIYIFYIYTKYFVSYIYFIYIFWYVYFALCVFSFIEFAQWQIDHLSRYSDSQRRGLSSARYEVLGVATALSRASRM